METNHLIFLPWYIALILCGSVLAVLSLFLDAAKLRIAWLIVSGSCFIVAAGYNIIQTIVSHKDEVL